MALFKCGSTIIIFWAGQSVLLQTGYEQVKPATTALKEAVTAAEVAHADETGFYINGKRNWLHTVSTPELTYFAPHQRRGRIATDAIGILPEFRGKLVHDNWATYFTYQLLAHALCNSHHLRDLMAIVENDQEQWAALMVLTLNYINDNGHINASKLVGADMEPAVVVAGFQEAVAILLEYFGQVDVAWSDVNRLMRGDSNLGVGGGPDVLHAVYGELEENGRFRGIAGDSYIMMISWDSDGKLSSQSIHQYGSATLDETSPHYDDQAQLFVNRELKPVWLSEADIRANLEREYRPGE